MIILHPFLFALFPILFLYSHTIHQALFQEILPLLFLSLVCTLLLFLLLSHLFQREKAGVVTSLLLVLFFSYGHLYNLLYLLNQTSNSYVYLLWILFMVSGLILLSKRSIPSWITPFLNIVSLVLILITSLQIGLYHWEIHKTLQTMERSEQESRKEPYNEDGERMDIYYIVLDAYARSDLLEEFYETSNQEFIESLEEMGFYVAHKSHSNYALTFLSLASSLNMRYLHDLVELFQAKGRDQRIAYHLIEENMVLSYLRDRGYTTVHFNSGWSGTLRNPKAHYNLSRRFYFGDDFVLHLLSTTMLRPFLQGDRARERVLDTFSRLKAIPQEIEGPTFTFAHILPPHPPYLFQEDGERVEEIRLQMAGDIWEEREAYREQLHFINRMVLETIEEILNEDKSTIIILQSDHGTASLYEWEDPSQDFLRERMGILLALYLPGEKMSYLYEEMTPVNIFPLLFHLYFHEEYVWKEDRIFFSCYDKPYKMEDVTKRLLPFRE